MDANTLGQGSKPAEQEAAWRNSRTRLQKNATLSFKIYRGRGNKCKIKHAEQIDQIRHKCNKSDEPTLRESKEDYISEGKNAEMKLKTE